VSLSNVLSARNTRDHVTFLADADQDVFNAKVSAAFGIQVGLHELLGHGSGKTFVERADGSFNFDKEAVEAQLGGPVGHYKPGQSWDSVFGGQASTMEECRAEAVGLYLCVLPEVQAIFGAAHGSPSEAHAGTGAGAEADISYVNWLNMARAGLLALQFYSPATKVWGQAHMQARYALLRVLLDANVARLVGTEGLTAEAVAAGTVQEGEAGVHVTLDRTLITSRGLPAIGAFLRKLQELKSSADAAEGLPWYARATAVPDAWLPLRDLVIAKRKPRQMFVQPVLETAAETAARGPVKNPGARVVRGMAQAAVTLIEFPATVDGLLDAFARRYPARDEELLRIWEAEAELHLIPA
jgi:dipeptidyl-peptidase-3